MAQSAFTTPIAQYPGAPPRFYHAHNWPGVDVMLPAPGSGPPSLDAGLAASNQSLLDDTLQVALCFEPATTSIKVIIDNTGAGHSWPSGAVQDRRAWVEVVAWLDGGVAYQSGVVPDGGSVTALNDPDLWLMRDCIFDDAGTQVNMFWEAASFEGNELPALVTFDQSNPATSMPRTSSRTTSSSGAPLGITPDRITARGAHPTHRHRRAPGPGGQRRSRRRLRGRHARFHRGTDGQPRVDASRHHGQHLSLGQRRAGDALRVPGSQRQHALGLLRLAELEGQHQPHPRHSPHPVLALAAASEGGSLSTCLGRVYPGRFRPRP